MWYSLLLAGLVKLLFLSISLQSSLSEGEVGHKIDERLGALAAGKSICEYISDISDGSYAGFHTWLQNVPRLDLCSRIVCVRVRGYSAGCVCVCVTGGLFWKFQYFRINHRFLINNIILTWLIWRFNGCKLKYQVSTCSLGFKLLLNF